MTLEDFQALSWMLIMIGACVGFIAGGFNNRKD